MCRILPTPRLAGQGPDEWSKCRIGLAPRFRAAAMPTGRGYAPAVDAPASRWLRHVALGDSHTIGASVDPAAQRRLSDRL